MACGEEGERMGRMMEESSACAEKEGQKSSAPPGSNYPPEFQEGNFKCDEKPD